MLLCLYCADLEYFVVSGHVVLAAIYQSGTLNRLNLLPEAFIASAQLCPPPPPTLRTQRVKDMVGEENSDNLTAVLAKLKSVMLRTPKSQVVQHSIVSSLAEG